MIKAFYNDPTQYQAHSFVREKIYPQTTIALRDSIVLNEMNHYTMKTIAQNCQVLPYSILIKNQKTIIGPNARFRPRIFYDEIIQNQKLGFTINPKNLSLSPDAAANNIKKNTPDFLRAFLQQYTTYFQTHLNAIEKNATLCDAFHTAMPLTNMALIKKASSDSIKRKNILSLPIFSLSDRGGFCPSEIQNAQLHDKIKSTLRKTGYPEFNNVLQFKIGWFDIVRTRYLIKHYKIDGILLNHTELLDGFKNIKLCSAYLKESEIGQAFTKTEWKTYTSKPPKAFLENHRGWQERTSELRHLNDFPSAFFKFLKRIEELIGCPIYGFTSCASYSNIIPYHFPSIF